MGTRARPVRGLQGPPHMIPGFYPGTLVPDWDDPVTEELKRIEIDEIEDNALPRERWR